MTRITAVVFGITIILLHSAAASSESRTTETSSKSVVQATKKSLLTPTPQSYISDKIINFLRPKTGAELMTEKKVARATATVTPSPLSPTTEPVAQKARSSVKPGYVPPPPPTSLSPQARQIRQEIQSILELNKKIKNIQGDRVQQLQRIQEQARLHQKILDQIDDGQEIQVTQETPDREALLAQEKLRIIHEETQRNRAVIEESVEVESETSQSQTEGDELVFAPADPVEPISWS